MASSHDVEQELRGIKHKIIGNAEAKHLIAEDEVLLTRVIDCLQPSNETNTRVEAANILYSISSGSQRAIEQLLHLRLLAALLTVVGAPEVATTPGKFKTSLGRALRTFIGSVADCACPELWGILPPVPPNLRKQAQFALEEFFQPNSTDIWLPLLTDNTFYPFICAIMATSIRTPAHRTVVCEWMPPSERAKASKGKRGWEKPLVSSLSAHSPGADLSLSSHMPTSSPLTYGAPTSVVGGGHGQGTGFIIQHLFKAVASTSSGPSQLISLEALSALCRDNTAINASFWKTERERANSHGPSSPIGPGHSPVEARLPVHHHLNPSLQSLLLVLQSPNPEVRVAATHLLSNIVKSTTPTPSHPLLNSHSAHLPGPLHLAYGGAGHAHTLSQHHSVILAVLHALNNIIQGEEESLAIRAKACFILSRLVKDDMYFVEAAVDCGSLQALFSALEWNMKPPQTETGESGQSEETISEDIEEPQPQLYLREAAFICLATIGLVDTKYSRQILELDASRDSTSGAPLNHRIQQQSAPVSDAKRPFLLPLLSRSITSPSLGVRYSALQLIRALTRAIAVLRTGLVDTDIPAKVIEVISAGKKIHLDGKAKAKVEKEDADMMDSNNDREEEHRAIIIAALMALCNLVNDYGPFRQKIIQSGAIEHLVRKTHSVDDEIRLNALWAIKNSLFNAKQTEKSKIMEVLTWDHYADLAQDSDRLIREQALILLQNITITNQDIDFIFSGLGKERLYKILQQALSNNHPDAVEHGINALNNIVSGPEPHRDFILQQKSLLTLLRSALSHSQVGVRRASANCICELLDPRHGPFRHRELREIGIEQALRAILPGRGGGGAGISYSQPISTASGFGAALGTSGPFAGASGTGGITDSPGLMGREMDREVIDAVKCALALIERGKELEGRARSRG